MPVKSIPDGYHAVTPYLVVDGAARAIEFYRQAFGAVETVRMPGPDGRIGHAEMKMGDAMVMLADAFPDHGINAPQPGVACPVSLMLYVDDVDAVVERAVTAGATIHKPVDLKFYGDRSGTLVDPFGHTWTIGTHVEDVTPEEMKRRMKELFGI